MCRSNISIALQLKVRFRSSLGKRKHNNDKEMAQTLLDQPLGDLRREINDLRQINVLHDYDMNKLTRMITISRDTLRETGNYQQHLLEQLEQFEISLADINKILRANHEQRTHLEQQKQQSGEKNDVFSFFSTFILSFSS